MTTTEPANKQHAKKESSDANDTVTVITAQSHDASPTASTPSEIELTHAVSKEPTVSEKLEKETTKPPNRWIGFFIFVINIADFITDILLGVSWITGQDDCTLEECQADKCSYADYQSVVAAEYPSKPVHGVIIIVCALIGFSLGIFGAWKEYFKGDAPTNLWDFKIICKIVIEDVVSFVLISFLTVQNPNAIGGISFALGGLSILVFMFKAVIWRPCKRSDKGCNKHKLVSFFCIFIWLGVGVWIVVYFNYGIVALCNHAQELDGCCCYDKTMYNEQHCYP